MNISSMFKPKVNAADMPLEMVARNTNLSATDKVKEASRQFESLLLQQILTESKKSSSLSGDEGDSSIKSIYDDMITQQLADSISRSGSFGLASSLQSRLVHQTLQKNTPVLQATKMQEAK